MKINAEACPYPLGKSFVNILESVIRKIGHGHAVTINFKDNSYDPVTGGFHPVEIRIAADGTIEYITDFAYVGTGQFTELAKEIDFDFSLGLFQHFSREFPISHGLELYRIWEQNFVSYYQMDVYRIIVEKD